MTITRGISQLFTSLKLNKVLKQLLVMKKNHLASTVPCVASSYGCNETPLSDSNNIFKILNEKKLFI